MTHADLFGGAPPQPAPEIKRTARISDCGRYRFMLTRIWEANKQLLVTCMLNPSTADAEKDDPTIRTLTHFAKSWGYGGLMVVNLFALRTPSPQVLLETPHSERMGPESRNRESLFEAFIYARHSPGFMLAAWGNLHPHLISASTLVLHIARKQLVDLQCLGETANGFPKHPMARGVHRIPRDQQPIMFRPAREVAE